MNRPTFPLFRPLLGLLAGVAAHAATAPSALLPTAASDLKVELVAREPLIRNPCAMAFDARGRLFVGYGPQYRNPTPDTPGDSIAILIDTDGDGIFDTTKIFATGLNCIQGLAWHGRDLWVGNSPDLTILRDLDGDDVADEYVKVFTDLGNIEHANHGHTWAPDGKLYFSEGTSKGLTQPGRVAPKPFRELWDVTAPPGTPDLPRPQTFTRANYKATYQDPKDDWGREGGVLRCDDLGANLEIVARGMRNPWDIAFDAGFNWLATDNDQSEGDRVVMPFYGAHFGWGHRWSTHWTGKDHLPTAPASGPVFDGSGTGIVYYDAPYLPPAYRGVWFFNDWLRKTTFVYRPTWDGALILPQGGRWEPVVRGGGAGRAVSSYGGPADVGPIPSALYKPVDLLIGPDGALYVSGWGEELGVVWKDGKQANEGRIFRISWPAAPASNWNTAKRTKPLAQWSVDELIADLGGLLPVWSIDAQDELVRRGASVKDALMKHAARADLSMAVQTWTLWTLGRIAPADRGIDAWFAEAGRSISPNARLQSIAIAAHRLRAARRQDPLPPFVTQALTDSEPRVRFAAVQAVAQSGQPALVPQLAAVAATERDRVTYYATWQALRAIARPEALRGLLKDQRGGVRRAALLALLENNSLERAEIQPLVQDPDEATANLAATWLAKAEGNPLIDIYPKPGDFVDSVSVKLTPGIKPASVRYTLDGSEPTMQSKSGHPGRLTETTTMKVALFVNGRKVGNTLVGTYRKRESASGKLPVLGQVTEPTKVDQVLPLLSAADPKRGPGLFAAAGCVACHRAGGEGRTIGPDLSAIGDRDDADSIIRSILYPNQIVVEGYSLLTVSTRDGKAYAGIFEAETDRSLRLVQLNGESVAIDRSTITSRQSVHESPMPAFDRVLAPAQVADLVAWLMQQRSLPGAAIAAPKGERSSDATTPANASFTWQMKPDRLTIAYAGKPVADYVFRDEQTLRPHFQNLHAPSGAQVTRNHPPRADEPADHATMHPGVWLAFGDINGQDFWRNKARIEHVSFTREPALEDGRLVFATRNRLVGADGVELGTQASTFTVTRAGDTAFLLTWEAVLRGENRELVFGDQEEMGLGVRMATELIEKNGGKIALSDGKSGAKVAWGNVADWCVYSGNRDGRVVGAAIFSATSNPRKPWWHTRDYGLMVANGFGKRAEPTAPDGKVTVAAGDALRLKYGVLLFDAPPGATPDIAAAYRTFATQHRSP